MKWKVGKYLVQCSKGKQYEVVLDGKVIETLPNMNAAMRWIGKKSGQDKFHD